MGRLFLSKQELEKVFGGAIEIGRVGIFVQDGGNGILGEEFVPADWTLWTGDESMGVPVVKKKKPVVDGEVSGVRLKDD